jgi:Flp pilus assembly protein TadD
MKASPIRALALLLLAVLLMAGCGRREPVPDAAAPQARAQALIEAGNAFYRAKDYTNAAKRYGAAVVVKTDDPAAYFGLGMALTRLGRDDEARRAYARARELAQQARGAGGDTAR